MFILECGCGFADYEDKYGGEYFLSWGEVGKIKRTAQYDRQNYERLKKMFEDSGN